MAVIRDRPVARSIGPVDSRNRIVAVGAGRNRGSPPAERHLDRRPSHGKVETVVSRPHPRFSSARAGAIDTKGIIAAGTDAGQVDDRPRSSPGGSTAASTGRRQTAGQNEVWVLRQRRGDDR
jgi:hypothetical protein